MMAVPLRSSFMRVLWVLYLAVIIRLNTVRGQGRLSSSQEQAQEQPVLAEEVRSALKEAGSIPPSAGEAHDVRGLVATASRVESTCWKPARPTFFTGLCCARQVTMERNQHPSCVGGLGSRQKLWSSSTTSTRSRNGRCQRPF